MGWTVILGGNKHGLENLANHAEEFSILGGIISMRKPADVLHILVSVQLSDRGELYCLSSPVLDSLPDASAVTLQASEWLNAWNGVASLAADAGPVGVHQVTHKDARGRQTASIALPFVVKPAMSPEKKEAMKALVQLSSDPAVNRVLGLSGKEPKDWVNAYRIFEVIENASGGIDGIAAHGWASKADIRRFKHTANSPDAIGDNARHGELACDPPRNPMSEAEASAFLTKIVGSFLHSKMQS
jgi:hypothetical protein